VAAVARRGDDAVPTARRLFSTQKLGCFHHVTRAGLRAMKKLVLLVGIVFSSACGSKVDSAIAELESFKNKMCECKDAACADGVEKEMKEWASSMSDDVKKADGSDEQKEKAKELRKAMRECRRAAMKTDAPK
jgi:hypothetical protein